MKEAEKLPFYFQDLLHNSRRICVTVPLSSCSGWRLLCPSRVHQVTVWESCPQAAARWYLRGQNRTNCLSNSQTRHHLLSLRYSMFNSWLTHLLLWSRKCSCVYSDYMKWTNKMRFQFLETAWICAVRSTEMMTHTFLFSFPFSAMSAGRYLQPSLQVGVGGGR